MTRCDGVVVALEGDEAWVEVAARAPACGRCEKAGGCAEGLTADDRPRRYRIANRIGARVGDHVGVALADGMLWRAALASYGVPLLLALGGALGGQFLGGEGLAIVGSATGLAAGLLLLRRRERDVRRGGQLITLESGKPIRIEEST